MCVTSQESKWFLFEPPFRVWHTAVFGKICNKLTAVKSLKDPFRIVQNTLITETELFITDQKRWNSQLGATHSHTAVACNHEIGLDPVQYIHEFIGLLITDIV